MIILIHIICAMAIVFTVTFHIHDMPERGVRAIPHIILAVGAIATGAEPYFTHHALTVPREMFLAAVTIFIVTKASFSHATDR